MPSTSIVKPEKWERPWPSRNCAYSINLRSGEAKYNREKLRVEKEAKSLERVYRQNIRKLNAAHRGVISMMGHTPYQNCSREHTLFEHNQPGFCYKRNGEPRHFRSLVESKTRRIIHDLDGKEGLLRTPASNIISDNPVMAEILSSPQIVDILCDLRTTAVLISNSELFTQFAKALAKHPKNPLKFNGALPLECLMIYRAALIQEFFDTLRIQMDIRRTAGKPIDRAMNNYLIPDDHADADRSGVKDLTEITTPVDEIFHHNYHYPLTDKQWNDAIVKRLRQEATLEDEDEDETKVEASRSSLLDTFKQFVVTVNPEDNLKGTPSTQIISFNPSALIPPSNTVAEYADQAATNLESSSTFEFKPSLFHSTLRSTKPKRNEFDSFVRNLVTEVENISEVGKNMVQLQKKKPQYDTVASPLVRLLRKKSLFSSLNEDDLLFYEYEGGRRDAASKMARGLNINQPRPGGFTFRVPSRSEIPGPATGAEVEEFSYKLLRPGTAATKGDLTVRPSSAVGSSSKSKARSRSITKNQSQVDISKIEIGGSGTRSRVKSNIISGSHHCTCSHQGQKSLKRLCCPACNAKLRSLCNEAQERDRKDKKISESSWKMPGLSHFWTKNSHKDTKPHHLLSNIPLTLRKNYAIHPSRPRTNLPIKKETMSTSERNSSLTGSSTGNRESTQWRGAPTPVERRRNLMPEVTKLMSKLVTDAGSKTNAKSAKFTLKPTPIDSISARIGTVYGNATSSNLYTKNNSFGPVNSKFIPSSWSVKSQNAKDKDADKSQSPSSKSTKSLIGDKQGGQMQPGGGKVTTLDSWTLKVDRMDIMKLKHELEVENVRQKMLDFEQQILNSNEEIKNL